MNRNYLRGVRLRSAPDKASYLSGLPMVRSLLEREELIFDRPVTFLVGENGTGKSTLLEGIAVALGFNAEGGTRNFCFSTAHTESPLHEDLTLLRGDYPKDGFFLRAESFYNAVSYLDELYRGEFGGGCPTAYGDRPLHGQSHGESVLSVVENRFGGQGLYLLDEPESALSPSRQLALLWQMNRLVEARSQLIIATHSPILMAFPGAGIYEFSERGIYPAEYRETEHYRLTRRFLEDPENVLRVLLKEE